jgi:uncharacterized protein
MATQTALITGASSGIGYEFAKIFAANNINLVLVARSTNTLEQLANELRNSNKITVTVIGTDLSNYNTANQIFNQLQAQKITITHLINNAGFGDFGFFADSSWPKQEQMLNLNITTLTYLTHLFLPSMVANKFGKVVNVASTAAFQPGPLMSVYFATKAYVLHFSEAISNELQGTGVTVTALCPGATQSDFQNKANMQESKLVKNKKLPTSKQVAEYGYKSMQKGAVVAIHGVANYWLANSVRFSPRALVVKLVRAMQNKA